MAHKFNDALSPSEVRRLLNYNSETGLLTWKARNDVPKEWNTRWAGKPAGCVQICRRDLKRILVNMNKTYYLGHRLAWVHFYGEWPSFEIDHEDRDPLNIRIGNLRQATHPQNAWNTSAHKDNQSGVKGISQAGKRWAADIMANGVRRRATFKLFEEAVAWRKQQEIELHGEFAPQKRSG